MTEEDLGRCMVFHCHRADSPTGLLFVGEQEAAVVCAKHGATLGDAVARGWRVDPVRASGWRIVQALSRPDSITIYPPGMPDA